MNRIQKITAFLVLVVTAQTYAGSSFWGGFAGGLTGGVVGNVITQPRNRGCTSCAAPTYVVRERVVPVTQTSVAPHQEIRTLRQTVEELQEKNEELKQKNKKLSAKIEKLEEKISKLEEKISG